MELIHVFRTLYRKKWILLLCSFVAVVAAFILTMNKKKLYKSSAQLSTGFTVSEDIKLSNENFNIYQIDVKFNNVIENITSPKVLSLVSYNLILHDLTSSNPFKRPAAEGEKDNKFLQKLNTTEAVKIFQNKKDSMLLLNPGSRQEKDLLKLLEIYGYDNESIKKYLTVARFQRTDYIDITYRSENPNLSAFLVNTLCKEFQKYYEAFRRERSVESILLLDSIAKKKKLELDNKIAARAQFLSDSVSSTVDPNLVGANKLSQISQYENAQSDELARIQDLTYQIRQLEQQLAENGITSNTPSNNDNSEYFALRRQYNNLYDDYINTGANDPEKKKRLDDLRDRMNAAAPKSTTSETNSQLSSTQRSSLMQQKIDAEGKLKSSNSKLAFYRTKLNELRSGLKIESPNSSASLERLDKEVELASAEYTSAKEKLNLASGMNEGVSNNFIQTLYGQPAIQPEPSRRIIILGLSGLSAFILSSLVFIFIDYFDQSIKTPLQFQKLTGLKLLGIVNFIRLKGSTLKDQVTQFESEEGNRSNSFRELLRKLRYEIEKSGKRIILFASTAPQQGKTTLSQALAFSLSLGKKKVLLLDTNFCNNDLTVLNGALPTLEQFSSSDEGFEFCRIEKLITKTGVDNVDIIGCKGGDYTPSEILPKNHLLNFLPELLKSYDYVFLESAPLNGFTDTKELVSYADAVIAIFSASSEIKQIDKESIKFFNSLGHKFLGAILNKVEAPNLNS